MRSPTISKLAAAYRRADAALLAAVRCGSPRPALERLRSAYWTARLTLVHAQKGVGA